MLKSKRIKPDKSKLKSSFEQYYSSSDHSCAGHVFSIFFKSRDFESFRYRILKIISKILPACSFMLLNILWFDHKNIKKSILTQIHVPKHGFLKSWSSIVKIFFTRYFILYQSDNFLIVLKIHLWYFEFYFYNNILQDWMLEKDNGSEWASPKAKTWKMSRTRLYITAWYNFWAC